MPECCACSDSLDLALQLLVLGPWVLLGSLGADCPHHGDTASGGWGWGHQPRDSRGITLLCPARGKTRPGLGAQRLPPSPGIKAQTAKAAPLAAVPAGLQIEAGFGFFYSLSFPALLCTGS